MRIAIVEDEILIREGIRKLLGRLNPQYEIVGEAGNGRDGLRIILSERPDLVITDIRMPDMDGLSMLEAVRDQGCSCKALVLSAYSEFAYAQQAVKLDVVEYLLKPIVMNDFIQAMQRVDRMLAQSAVRYRHPESLHSLRGIYRMLIGGHPLDHEIKAYLQSAHGLNTSGLFTLILFYASRAYTDAEMTMLHDLKQHLCALHGQSARIVELEEERMLACLYAGSIGTIQAKLEKNLYGSAVIAALTEFTGLENLNQVKQQLSAQMDFAIPLDQKIINLRCLQDTVALKPLVYPVAIEKKARAALWAKDFTELESICREWTAAVLTPDALHSPRAIKECMLRFLWALYSEAVERGVLEAGRLEYRTLLERITAAKTRAELTQLVQMLLDAVSASRQSGAKAVSEIVERALARIQSYYSTGITLEELASQLSITPEYLSQQFHKEMGINFSAYIRRVRIEHAKILLRTTSLQIQQIADRVGYNDSKYFARVFKSETGMMPVEYRQRA